MLHGRMSNNWKWWMEIKRYKEEEEEVKGEVDCMWYLSSTDIRELYIQCQDLSNTCAEKLILNLTCTTKKESSV